MKFLVVENVEEVIACLKQGMIVVLPSETSYGLSCDAGNAAAVSKIFQIKGRESGKPVLVLVDSVATAKKYLQWNECLEKIAQKYWSDANCLPLTVIGCYISPTFKEGARGRSRLLGWIKTISFRRNLRQEQTKAEKMLWYHLNNKKLGGLKFRRQHGVGPYIVDFYQSDSQTVVEIDGDVHFAIEEQVKKDQVRELFFNSHGYHILRFNNVDIINNLQGVLDHIYFNCEKWRGDMRRDPTLALPLKGEESVALARGVISADNTLAVRVTHHPLLREICAQLGRPIVSTSANLAGATPLYSPVQISQQFSSGAVQPDVMVDMGELPVTPNSTIISCVENNVKILRQGELVVEI